LFEHSAPTIKILIVLPIRVAVKIFSAKNVDNEAKRLKKQQAPERFYRRSARTMQLEKLLRTEKALTWCEVDHT
jgi:hypothetical protein